jgi:uncharacterized protein (DUF1684 family)
LTFILKGPTRNSNLGKGEGLLRFTVRAFVIASTIGFLFSSAGISLSGGDEVPGLVRNEKETVMKWRKERDQFFRTHQRSPLTPQEKKRFKGLEYFPFNSNYYFEGPIEREILHINDPKYYATFLTNKGTNKRYIRYGKFRFKLEGKVETLEVYKSILSDNLFIPFKDLTNGKETYEGGRYIDAEILPGYKMVLDFNMAYFPSCAYNDKFTCAIPPKENFLEIQIRAGEKNHKEEKP